MLQQERENYEYLINEGKIVHKLSGVLLDTSQEKGTKWIFVMSTAKRLYAGKVTCVTKIRTSIFVTLCFVMFIITKFITATWSIHPERERCIPALQFFSRWCHHSCWKIYCRKWNYQGTVKEPVPIKL
jgi:hypothetical protein